jgi:hypothetical protein
MVDTDRRRLAAQGQEMTMTLVLTIDASTTDEAIYDAMPYVDMRHHAIERRDDAAAVETDNPVGTVLELHDIDGVDVLWSPAFGYAYVNQRSPGVGNSLQIDNGGAWSPESAASQWSIKRVTIDARTRSWSAEWADGRTDSGEYDDDADTESEVLREVESEIGLQEGTLASAEARGSDGWTWTR